MFSKNDWRSILSISLLLAIGSTTVLTAQTALRKKTKGSLSAGQTVSQEKPKENSNYGNSLVRDLPVKPRPAVDSGLSSIKTKKNEFSKLNSYYKAALKKNNSALAQKFKKQMFAAYEQAVNIEKAYAKKKPTPNRGALKEASDIVNSMRKALPQAAKGATGGKGIGQESLSGPGFVSTGTTTSTSTGPKTFGGIPIDETHPGMGMGNPPEKAGTMGALPKPKNGVGYAGGGNETQLTSQDKKSLIAEASRMIGYNYAGQEAFAYEWEPVLSSIGDPFSGAPYYVPTNGIGDTSIGGVSGYKWVEVKNSSTQTTVMFVLYNPQGNPIFAVK
jgi:hypothetical protein